ncbi:hypothetical protein XPN_1045, partial [Xanthomonas arboricola pv. pruni MAFF 301427]
MRLRSWNTVILSERAVRYPCETVMTDLIPLEQAHCLPRKGSDHKLGEARLAELLPQVP